MEEPKFKYEGGDNFAAYDARGRAMHLPNNGRVQLPAGCIISGGYKGEQWFTLQENAVLVKRTKQVEYTTYHSDYVEEL